MQGDNTNTADPMPTWLASLSWDAFVQRKALDCNTKGHRFRIYIWITARIIFEELILLILFCANKMSSVQILLGKRARFRIRITMSMSTNVSAYCKLLSEVNETKGVCSLSTRLTFIQASLDCQQMNNKVPFPSKRSSFWLIPLFIHFCKFLK